MFYKEIENYRRKMLRKLEQNQQILKSLPSGTLSCRKDRKSFGWVYNGARGSRKRLSKKRDREMAERLAYRTYLELETEELKRELSGADAYLATLASYPPTHERHHIHTSEELVNHPEFSGLLSAFVERPGQKLEEWKSASFLSNPFFPEGLKEKVNKNLWVRSKTEGFIALALFAHNIPFRYECALQLGDKVIYPDFTIMDPRTGKVYYWEHFGMMDDLNYCSKTFQKMRDYAVNGIIPGIDLIMTFETSDQLLTPDRIEKIIEELFGD